MGYCAVKMCHNASQKHHNDSKITFHLFPSNPIVAAKWIEILRKNRKEEFWKPAKHTRICSAHFDDKDLYITKQGIVRLQKSAIPTKNLFMCCKDCHHIGDNTDNPSEMDKSQLQPQPPQGQLVIFFKEESQHNNDTLFIPIDKSQPQPKPEPVSDDDDEDDDDDDILSIYDTPQEYALRKKLARKASIQRKHFKMIRALQQKVRRLKMKNASLQNSLKKLLSKKRDI